MWRQDTKVALLLEIFKAPVLRDVEDNVQHSADAIQRMRSHTRVNKYPSEICCGPKSGLISLNLVLTMMLTAEALAKPYF